jgi:hypothetical protein
VRGLVAFGFREPSNQQHLQEVVARTAPSVKAYRHDFAEASVSGRAHGPKPREWRSNS